MIHISELMRKCEEEGIKITKMGLYVSGEKYGFIYEDEKNKTKEFDKEKFLKWIELAKEKAPENWLTVKQLSEKMNISISQAYILIKDENSGARTFGTNGVMYVDPSRIEKIIAKRGNRYEL